MRPSSHGPVVGASLLAFCLLGPGCSNNRGEETEPPDPLVVPQGPEGSGPLHMSEDEDYEEYEEPEEYTDPASGSLENPANPSYEAAQPDEEEVMDQVPEVDPPATDE